MWCVHLANPIEKSKWKITTAFFSLFAFLFRCFNLILQIRFENVRLAVGVVAITVCLLCAFSHVSVEQHIYKLFSAQPNRTACNVHNYNALSFVCEKLRHCGRCRRRFFCPLRPGTRRLYHFHFSTCTKLFRRRLWIFPVWCYFCLSNVLCVSARWLQIWPNGHDPDGGK